VRCHLLWIDGSQPPVHALLLGIDVEEPHGSHYDKKPKDHFPARQWSSFLCLIFLSQSPVQWQGYHSGQIWPAPTVLVYLASGLLLGRPPILSPFPHSSWNSCDSASLGFTITTKNSNSPPPGSCLCCPLLQKQIDPTIWTDDINVGWAWTALLIQIKLKNPSQFPHPKQYPLKPEGRQGLMPIINSLEHQGLLVSYSNPYNKFKILIKVNFKIQVTK
jgi:hypothetical protein